MQIYFSRVEQYQRTILLFSRKLLPLAKQNKQAALADYQAGHGDFLTLIRAEKDWHNTRLKAKKALTMYHQSLAMLEYSIGVSDISAGNGR